MTHKTTGIRYLSQPGGKNLSWSEDSGIALLEQDGLFFKDLARTGSLLPYEDWRLDDWSRAKDLASRLSIPQIAGLMLYSPHQSVPGNRMPFLGSYGGKPFEEAGCEASALSDQQKDFLRKEHIRHVLVTDVQDAATQTPEAEQVRAQAVQESMTTQYALQAVQQMAEIEDLRGQYF